jgi:S1-C subfamily serine protease
MRSNLAERFDALSGTVPSAPTGRRSPFRSRFPPSLTRRAAAAALCVALAFAPTAPFAQGAEQVPTNAALLASVVTLQVRAVSHARSAASLGAERRGTGVVVEPGVILTSALLVQEADSIAVTTFDARTVAAAVVAQDEGHGVAVLRPAAVLGVRPLPIARSAAVENDAPVVIVSAARAPEVVLAKAVARRDFAGESEYLVENAIIAAPAIPDCAGAALVDGTGGLVGVGAVRLASISTEVPPRGPVAGILFIPVERFQPLLAQTRGGARASRKPWLGLVTEESDAGPVLTRVPPASPADRAGLRVGDAVVAVDGESVRTRAELYRRVWRAGGPGVQVRLAIRRDGGTREVPVRAIDVQDYLVHRA